MLGNSMVLLKRCDHRVECMNASIERRRLGQVQDLRIALGIGGISEGSASHDSPETIASRELKEMPMNDMGFEGPAWFLVKIRGG